MASQGFLSNLAASAAWDAIKAIAVASVMTIAVAVWESIKQRPTDWVFLGVVFCIALVCMALLLSRRGAPASFSGPSAGSPIPNHRVRWLLDLHALGTHTILDRPLAYQHLSRVEQDAETWEKIVIEALKHCEATPLEMSRFTNLQSVQPIHATNAVSPEHQNLLNVVYAKLTVLRQIAERIQSEKSP